MSEVRTGTESAAVGEGVPLAMPAAPMLTYLTGKSTPTRARKIAAVGGLLVGVMCLAMAATVILQTLWQIQRIAEYLAWGGSPTYAEYHVAWDSLGTNYYGSRLYDDRGAYGLMAKYVVSTGIWGRIIATGLWLIPGLGLPVLAAAVRRGRPVPSRLSMGLVGMVIGMVMPLVVVPACAGLLMGWGRNPKRGDLAWLLVLPLGIFLILILKDLCSYLLWIGRAPFTDKPAVAFLSMGGEKASNSHVRAEPTGHAAESAPLVQQVSTEWTGGPMPTAPVLSYLTNVSTPTRVRIVAARALVIMVMLEGFVFLGTGYLLVQVISEFAKELAGGRFWGPWAGGGPGPGLNDYLEAMSHYLLEITLALLLFGHVLTLLILNWPVRRGRPGACRAARGLIVPLIIFLVVVGILAGCLGLFWGFGLSLGYAGKWEAQPEYLLLLVVMSLAIVAVLVLKDVCVFLTWIVRNPLEDKPAVFLPGAGGAARDLRA